MKRFSLFAPLFLLLSAISAANPSADDKRFNVIMSVEKVDKNSELYEERRGEHFMIFTTIAESETGQVFCESMVSLRPQSHGKKRMQATTPDGQISRVYSCHLNHSIDQDNDEVLYDASVLKNGEVIFQMSGIRKPD